MLWVMPAPATAVAPWEEGKTRNEMEPAPALPREGWDLRLDHILLGLSEPTQASKDAPSCLRAGLLPAECEPG